MRIEQAANILGLPKSVLDAMVSKGLIHSELDEVEVKALAILSRIWGDDHFLKMQMRKKKKTKRYEIALFPQYSTAELFVLKLYLRCKEGEKLSIEHVQDLSLAYLKFKLPRHLITKMRDAAYNLRRVKLSERKDITSFLLSFL
ncbi:hypothetical protein RW64_09270 [Geobacter sulfurreducens]|nr:hypothetical protein RW64_09270 [Geobacter sulfurreducens]